MNNGYFITGTDTDVGKTWATVTLMHYFRQQGRTVAAMKPVASGCVWQDGQWQNADALLLQHHASSPLPYPLINPYAYEEPVSPHLAGVANPAQMETIISRFQTLQSHADRVLVEGAGGWYAPINAEHDISDLAFVLGLPVILVVAIRLGCINHAKLSHQAITLSGLPCAGWLAVCNDATMRQREANIATLAAALPSPLLGVLPYQATADFVGLAGLITPGLR
ncbi:dethiobiotin synthase [Methylovulum psychrotolerans]|uniref:ATP-dependent dethiobiotin synthetase BioD n=1 Tax=Methylovulum psychrotolerans TaxID=1704499 RepID=A0A2S5CNT0_9GAMM|nr:dethiobiotin synthase [Methylovulum psychrotolerans]POZ52475.1 dethiobiotin synthase [Methylovulum psychrotolerans]